MNTCYVCGCSANYTDKGKTWICSKHRRQLDHAQEVIEDFEQLRKKAKQNANVS